MNDRARNFVTERKKNALDNPKLKLSTPCPSAPTKKSNLVWGLYQNNPRITIYTGDPVDMDRADKGVIRAAMDAPTFMMLAGLLNTAIDAEPGFKEKIENYNTIFLNGKPSEKPMLVSETWVGKDEEGVVWISVIAYNKERPKIKFPLLPSDFHHFYHGNGQRWTKAEASVAFARGYMRIISEVVTHLLVTEFQETPKKDNNQRQGGGNRGGQSNYGHDQTSQGSDDDNGLPF